MRKSCLLPRAEVGGGRQGKRIAVLRKIAAIAGKNVAGSPSRRSVELKAILEVVQGLGQSDVNGGGSERGNIENRAERSSNGA